MISIAAKQKKPAHARRRAGELIRNFITENFQPGEMIPGEAELISSLNVSRYAVLKELTKLVVEGVVERRQGCGTFMAKAGNGVNSRNIAFIANEFESHMNAEIMRGVDDYLRKRDLNLLLLNSDFNRKRELSNLIKAGEERFAGVLAILEPDSESLDAAKRLIKKGIPFVQIDRDNDELEAPHVESDHEGGAYEAVSHLISMGHRNIAHITFPDPEHSPLSPVVRRYKGYVNALNDNDIELKEEYVERITAIHLGENIPEGLRDMLGYEPMHKLLSMPVAPPTAVFLLNDSIAPGVYKAINNHGLRVPDDISVVGFDDDILAQYLNPSMTTLRQPFREIGSKAAGLLETLMEGERISNNSVCISGKLTIRNSVKRIEDRKIPDNRRMDNEKKD